MIINADDSGFIVYQGDRHFGAPPSTYLTDIRSCDADTLVGTRIVYSAESGKLTIQCDFLGTEPVYYCHQNQSLWVTDRIENLTRVVSCTKNPVQIYTSVMNGATIADNTIFNEVKQTRPLQKITFDCANNRISVDHGNSWSSDPDADVAQLYRQIDDRLFAVLQASPHTNLMLSAGWDSRVLMADSARIKQTYTHGDLTSREIKIAFKLGSSLQVPMQLATLEETPYGAKNALEMLHNNGQCYFPHWYHAAQKLARVSSLPLSAGLMVEHFSGHYGVNSLPGEGRLMRLFHSMVLPDKFDNIDNNSAIDFLAPRLADGFKSLPWFFNEDVNFSDLTNDFTDDVRHSLSEYVGFGTSGIQELSERFKIEHSLRQYFSMQTKSAANLFGYHHPFTDSKLAQLVLTLKYRHRINYKLSRHVVKSRAPELLELPLAATLVKASSPIIMQEASRAVRVTGELMYSKLTGKLPKGLGWNNFQFLNRTSAFHEYADMLVDDIWDKPKIHRFLENYSKCNAEAYSILILLTKMVTTDFRLHPQQYQ
ncbi:hypothetical protein [Alteromonas ponticola]|uniref:Asparagine synthetase domain-containing protein n=1 Tax=Alteromonas ponticola TaxID=2720613 RepID=A0ABX1R1A4_9ALTE|nr:hypothetical protein [Alteromonas ponticola]NMH59053.1 hypothetical protein [Alteromonas ponticola]